MKVKALIYKKDIIKDNIYEVIKQEYDGFWVRDDVGDKNWLPSWSCEIINEPTLKEQYLVSGNVVETRKGEKYLVVENTLMNLDNGFNISSAYNDDLIAEGYDEVINYKYNIVKVYKRTRDCGFYVIKDYLKLIWQREPKVKEVTMEELEKHYGCKVKVVK
jgi:hypothetical protein